MTDYADLEKRLEAQAADIDPATMHQRAEADGGIAWSDGASCSLLREAARALAEARQQVEAKWLDAKSPFVRHVIEGGRWPAAIEAAAKVAEGFATCPCNGEHGRCNENDAPRAIAQAIRDLSRARSDSTETEAPAE